MSILDETQVLNNGVEIPNIGLGTWQMTPEEAETSVEFAINNGYKHIDTASAYGNSHAVGAAWKKTGVAREDIFITTKIRAEYKSYDEAVADIEKELKNLQTDYIDLILIHCPQPWPEYRADGSAYRYEKENLEVWRAMEEYYKAGKLKAIGVSNFHPHDLQNIIDNAEIKPAVNQIRFLIGYTQDDYVKASNDNGVVIEAYSPLGTGSILGNEDIKTVADKYGKTVAQVAIRYCLQKGHVVLPKSKTEKYILQNADVDFEINDEDMAYLDTLVEERK